MHVGTTQRQSSNHIEWRANEAVVERRSAAGLQRESAASVLIQSAGIVRGRSRNHVTDEVRRDMHVRNIHLVLLLIMSREPKVFNIEENGTCSRCAEPYTTAQHYREEYSVLQPSPVT